MAFLSGKDVDDAYTASDDESKIWREDYPEYERLMNNGLLDDLDETLPEVNDGSLAASLFKLPKRIVPSNLQGRAKALDVDDSWITELANIEWTNVIVPNANSQAPYIRKWKDAVRKAAGFGGQPIINLFVERGNYEGSDFIVPPAYDVKLEAGKTSDYDSDIIFWDVYYSKLGLANLIENAEEEMAESDEMKKAWQVRKAAYDKSKGPDDPDYEEKEPEPYNKWNVVQLKEIQDKHLEENRDPQEEEKDKRDKGVKRSGYHFYIAFQRGVGAPFEMRHRSYPNDPAREWSNPDPTGDISVHYLYCYQDFVNPYGIGIVKLAGGTQNVLDYMRQADIKATQLGLEPPVKIKGTGEDVDEDSLTYEQRAHWIVGDSDVETVEIATQVYTQLPSRMAMYQTSLQKIIPMGDSTIGSGSGDPQYSKTPAGVKQQAASLSIDDEDFKDNFYVTYAAVAKSMINTHFANMQGKDLRKLSDEERDILMKAGLEFPVDPLTNQPTNELDVIWDEARATFDFEVIPPEDKTTEASEKLNGLLNVAKLRAGDPEFDADLEKSGKKLDMGELYTEVVSLSTDNKKIIQDISPADEEKMKAAQQASSQPDTQDRGNESLPIKDVAAFSPQAGVNMLMQNQLLTPQEAQAEVARLTQPAAMSGTGAPGQPPQDPNVTALMQAYHVDQNIAEAMLAAEKQGYDPKLIVQTALKHQQAQGTQGGPPAPGPALPPGGNVNG